MYRNRELLNDIYNVFKSWYIKNYDEKNVPTKKKFGKEVKKKSAVKQLRKNGINGKCIVNIKLKE